jgi:GTP diphosphokinase / guanosine-3',5'-bis(diphosphate) 3'-diphosphatase
LTNPSVKLANCCTPIMGDDIVGYVTKGTGIVVHRVECKNVETFIKDRLLDVFWGESTTKKYETNLRITVLNRDNILAEIINSVTSSKGKLNQVSAQVNRSKEGLIKLKVEVGNLMELDSVLLNIQKIKGVYSIERVC